MGMANNGVGVVINNKVWSINLTQLLRRIMATTAYHELASVIRGHHIHKHLWTPFVGERLDVEKEHGNKYCSYAVAVVNKESGGIIGRVPLELSQALWNFLTDGGVVLCEVTGKRRKGKGLEVPCVYHLTGITSTVQRVQQALTEL